VSFAFSHSTRRIRCADDRIRRQPRDTGWRPGSERWLAGLPHAGLGAECSNGQIERRSWANASKVHMHVFDNFLSSSSRRSRVDLSMKRRWLGQAGRQSGCGAGYLPLAAQAPPRPGTFRTTSKITTLPFGIVPPPRPDASLIVRWTSTLRWSPDRKPDPQTSKSVRAHDRKWPRDWSCPRARPSSTS
jgi:hypothetical protein